jgi:CheY-like chemotaxis protein
VSTPILWAEDDAQDRRLIEYALRDYGASVTFADDGVDLLDKLYTLQPERIVLDLKMPRLGGTDVLRRLRESRTKTGKLPVIVFTSSDEPAEVNQCRDLGVDAYIQKPLEFLAFSAVVRDIAIRSVPSSPEAAQGNAQDGA